MSKPELQGKMKAYLEEHGNEPYVWSATGPTGFDCSRLVRAMTEPTDWNEWIRRDRWGAVKALLRIELRSRLHVLRDRVERRFVNLISKRR